MAAGVGSPLVQRAQTGYRLDLVERWRIPVGARVLEVGCGQGDLTAVLADAVGGTGRVVAVDIAAPTYGAPVTLGDSRAFLLASTLRDRIDMRFGVDLLDPSVTFADNEFDCVVLAHCGWYFASLPQLADTLRRVRPWARRLCFAEWGLTPTSVAQLPHLLAVLAQGQIEANGSRGSGNVRAPFSVEQLLRVLDATGWQVTVRQTMDTTGLQDADWEVNACQHIAADDARMSAVSGLARDLIISQLDTLNALARDAGNQPLPAYAITAERLAAHPA